MRLSSWLFASLVVIFASTAQAQAKPEDAIKYRQALYRVLLWNWMPMNAMARGRIPFNANEFAKRSERVAGLATQLLEGYPVGSHAGAHTDAKPEIWTHFADFTTKMKSFETESAKLAVTAKGTSEEATKAQFTRVGATCKSCHDKYKIDD